MQKIIIAILLTFVLLQTSFACLNMHRTLASGEVVYNEYYDGIVTPQFSDLDASEYQEYIQEFLDEYKETKSIESYNDYGALLTITGEYAKAKQVFLEIEKNLPNQYETATNLGTVYELEGILDSALYWINRGIALNPKSHNGSEWIHLKILEFKRNKPTNPIASILGLDFGKDSIPTAAEGFEMDALVEQIYAQLHERLFFAKAPNFSVASMYFDYGNALALSINLEAALEAYGEAKKFGLDSSLLDARIAKMTEMVKETELEAENHESIEKTLIESNIEDYLAYFLIGIAVFAIMFAYVLAKMN